MSTSKISLYKTIGTDLVSEDGAGIRVQKPDISYRDILDNEIKQIDVPMQEVEIKMNELDDNWYPEQNDLIYKQLFRVEHPDALFGSEGVTNKKNVIGLAAHIYSKEAKFQKTIPFGSIYYDEKPKSIIFEHTFNAGTLRGTINFEFFFYLQKIENELFNSFYQADSVGSILSDGNIDVRAIIVDGEGSMFPIGNFAEKNGPLWKIEKRWSDPMADSFDATNVILKLNREHPLFSALQVENRRVNKMLMGEILINAMSMIIDQILNKEDIKLNTRDDYEEGTIMSTVAYWVDVFNVNDTSDIFTIQNSLNESVENLFIGGDVE